MRVAGDDGGCGWGFEVSCWDGRFTHDVNTREDTPEEMLAWMFFTFTNPEYIAEA